MCKGVRRFVAALLGLQYPCEFFLAAVHLYNTLVRLWMVGILVGIMVYAGPGQAAGLAVSPRSLSKWPTPEPGRWSEDSMPRMQPLLEPGGPGGPTALLVLLVFLCASDLSQCRRVQRDTWFAAKNDLDWHWHQVTYAAVPLLLAHTATLLGTHDVQCLAFIAVNAGVSGLCAATVEGVFALTEHSDDVNRLLLKPLYTMHGLGLAFATQGVLMPLTLTIFDADPKVTHMQGALAVAVMALYATLLGTTTSLHLACEQHRERFPGDRSVALCNQGSEEWIVSEPAWHDARSGETSEQRREPVCCTTHTGMHARPETPGTPRKEGPVWVGPTDPYRSSSSSSSSSRPNTGSESSARHAGPLPLGAPPVTFLGNTPEELSCVQSELLRRDIGLLVAWRRYFVVSALINTILGLSLVQLAIPPVYY